MGTGLCPVGLVFAGGKSGVKVTAASTVRDGPSWYLLYPAGPEVHRQALGPAGFSRYGRGRNGCAEDGPDVVLDEVGSLRRRVSVQWTG